MDKIQSVMATTRLINLFFQPGFKYACHPHHILKAVGAEKGNLLSLTRHFCLAPDMKSRLDDIVKKDKVVVFMKGVPDSPRCGFSNAVIQVLKMHGAPYTSYDVLSDEDLRQAIKEYSNWPTIPQVYINGEFVGGCDILLQMHRTSELVDTLKAAGIASALVEKQP